MQIDALSQEHLRVALRHILLQQDQLMADVFTLDEIEALDRLYHDPVGRSAMNNLPL